MSKLGCELQPNFLRGGSADVVFAQMTIFQLCWLLEVTLNIAPRVSCHAVCIFTQELLPVKLPYVIMSWLCNAASDHCNTHTAQS